MKKKENQRNKSKNQECMQTGRKEIHTNIDKGDVNRASGGRDQWRRAVSSGNSGREKGTKVVRSGCRSRNQNKALVGSKVGRGGIGSSTVRFIVRGHWNLRGKPEKK